jgi:hypothetical protein
MAYISVSYNNKGHNKLIDRIRKVACRTYHFSNLNFLHFHISFLDLQSRMYHPHVLISKNEGPFNLPQTKDPKGRINGILNNDTVAEKAPHIIIPKGDDAALTRLHAQNTLRKIRASWLYLEHQVIPIDLIRQIDMCEVTLHLVFFNHVNLLFISVILNF